MTRRKNPGQVKYVEFEMWPIVDPVTQQPAILVSENNITRRKSLELGLMQEKRLLETNNE